MVPLFRGLGYAIVVICCVSELYYAVICGWSFFYLFAGMQSELPWTTCDGGESWHTPNCYTKELAEAWSTMARDERAKARQRFNVNM